MAIGLALTPSQRWKSTCSGNIKLAPMHSRPASDESELAHFEQELQSVALVQPLKR